MRNPFKVVNDIFHKYGWTYGTFGSTYEGFCSVGAINYAIDRGLLTDDESRYVMGRLQQVTRSYSIPQWNDSHSAKEVLAIWKRLEKEYDEAMMPQPQVVVEAPAPEPVVEAVSEPVVEEVAPAPVVQIEAIKIVPQETRELASVS